MFKGQACAGKVDKMTLAIVVLLIVSVALYGAIRIIEKADAAMVARQRRASEIHAQRRAIVDWDSLPPEYVRRSNR
jgi:hypothetical protein